MKSMHTGLAPNILYDSVSNILFVRFCLHHSVSILSIRHSKHLPGSSPIESLVSICIGNAHLIKQTAWCGVVGIAVASTSN